MKKLIFLTGIISLFFFGACEHWPPGWIVPPLDEDEDEDGETVVSPDTDGGMDASAETPDVGYIPDSEIPAGTPDAGNTDGGGPDACVCVCEDDDGHDHDYGHNCGHHRGHGHSKLHCHTGGHCHQFFGEGEECERGYHCHIGHGCGNEHDRGHPECEGDTSPIYDPYDTCGNPCQCPEDDDLADGDDDDYDNEEEDGTKDD